MKPGSDAVAGYFFCRGVSACWNTRSENLIPGEHAEDRHTELAVLRTAGHCSDETRSDKTESPAPQVAAQTFLSAVKPCSTRLPRSLNHEPVKQLVCRAANQLVRGQAN